MSLLKPDFAIVGGLREDYFITPNGEIHLQEIGGNALYAAVGAALWKKRVGLMARIGENYPSEWLTQFETKGFDTRGIKILPGMHDTRTFYAYVSLEERVDTNPNVHFARLGQPVPPQLKDYVTSTEGQEERQRFNDLAVRPIDVPKSFEEVRGVHLAPCDYLTQRTLPEKLHELGIKFITCDPSVRFMQPSLKKEVSGVVRGLSAFLPSEMEVKAYYRHDTIDLWEACAEFSAMGCPTIVIKRGANGSFLYHQGEKWHIPAYTASVRDVTGAGDAYGGGFNVGLAETNDPVEAAVRGAVSASIVIENVGALSALEANPQLAAARRNSLKESVRKL
jgi:sugar/nucleoside kinase (ribokinase family)